MRISRRQREAFAFYTQCQDTQRLPRIEMEEAGVTAIQAFTQRETHGGELLPCREPELLSRALNGKEWQGLTEMNAAEDYVGRILFASDLKEYPAFVRKAILGQAAKIALATLGFVPTFIRTGEDFSTLQPT